MRNGLGRMALVNLFNLLEICLIHLPSQFELPLQRPHLLFVLTFQLSH